MFSYRVWRAAIPLLLVLLLPALLVAQEKDDKKKKQKEEGTQAQVRVLAKAVDASASAPQADAGVQWRSDFSMRGQENKTYLPFTLTIDSSKLKPGTAVLYVRVAQKGQQPSAGTPDEKEKKDTEKTAAGPLYPFETINPVELKAQTGQPYALTRAVLVPGGEYDLYVAVAEQTGEPSKDKPNLGRTVLGKQAITVPDYNSTELTTTPVLLAKKVEQLSAPLTPEQQADRPYALGGLDITPSTDHVFSKKEELPFLFVVYGVQVNEAGKPDMQIEYNFHQKTAEGEKFFNRTSPQQINGSTLPPETNLTATRQMTGGQTIPLASFPEGEYRLEIKINDKLANKSITRDVTFSVTP